MWIEAFDFQTETYLKHIKETLNAPIGSKLWNEIINFIKIYNHRQALCNLHCMNLVSSGLCFLSLIFIFTEIQTM